MLQDEHSRKLDSIAEDISEVLQAQKLSKWKQGKKIDQNKYIEPQQSLTPFQVFYIHIYGIQGERKRVEKIFDEMRKKHFQI